MSLHHHALPSSERSLWVRSLDPRGKLLGALFCVTIISLIPVEKAAWVAVFSVGFLVIAQQSGLGFVQALLRASVVLPFVLLPVLLRPWDPETTWSRVLLYAAGLGGKALASAVVLVVLVATTPLVDLCAAAERLGVPRALTQTILLTERYSRLLGARFSAMMLSARLRGFVLRRRREKVIGAMAGSLLLRTMDRADRVFWAMKARGYQGHLPRLEALHFHRRDLFAVLVILGWGVGLLWLGR